MSFVAGLKVVLQKTVTGLSSAELRIQVDRFSSLKSSVVLQRLRTGFEEMKKGNSGVFSFCVGMKGMAED